MKSCTNFLNILPTWAKRVRRWFAAGLLHPRLGNFEFSVAGVFALNHAVAFIGAITGVFGDRVIKSLFSSPATRILEEPS